MSSTFICELTGVLRDPQFHRCRLLLQELSALHPRILPKIHGVTERDYLEHVRAQTAVINAAHPSDPARASQRLQHCTDPFILVNQQQFLANEDNFIAFAIEHTRRSRAEILIAAAFGATVILDKDQANRYAAVDAEGRLQERAEAAAEEAVFRFRHVSGNPFVYMLFELDGVTLPRVEIELFHGVCPKTCANFVALCQGTVPDVSDDVRMLGYKGSSVHRIVHGGWIQAGDVTINDGEQAPASRGDGAPRSLYGREFADESFAVAHDQMGVVAMANDGVPHTNGSQFFITLAPLPQFNRRKVAFGRVVSGFTTLQRLGGVETHHERPSVPCKIVDAGTIQD